MESSIGVLHVHAVFGVSMCRVAHKQHLRCLFMCCWVAATGSQTQPATGSQSQPTQASQAPSGISHALGGRAGKCIYTCPGVYTFAGWYNWLLLVVCRREWLYPSGVQLASAGCTSEGVQEIQEIQRGVRRRDFLEFLEFLEFLDFVCLLQPSRTVPGSSGDFAFSAFVAVFIHHVNFGLNLLRN